MPTNHKTPHLQLNSWLGTDKPLREDFVADNLLIDTLLGEHLQNSTLHLTSSDREQLDSPFVCGEFAGSGSASGLHVLPFAPRFVLVYLKGSPLSVHQSEQGYTLCNWAVAAPGSSSGGASITGKSLSLTQTQAVPSDGIFYNLNAPGGQYGYIAFR